MAKHRILIIDSDAAALQNARDSLTAQGYEVSTLVSYPGPKTLVGEGAPHLIVADSIDAAREIRQASRVPVIIASRKFEPVDRIAGLEAGADDYMGKPYDLRELLLRIQTILRRVGNGQALGEGGTREHEVREWRFKGLTVQSNRRRVLLDGRAVELTTAEFDLLRLLVSNADIVLSRERILEELRGVEWEAFDRSIDILVSRLRDKLSDDPRRPRFIRTIRSVGYQFVGEEADGPQPAGPSAPRVLSRV